MKTKTIILNVNEYIKLFNINYTGERSYSGSIYNNSNKPVEFQLEIFAYDMCIICPNGLGLSFYYWIREIEFYNKDGKLYDVISNYKDIEEDE